MLHTGVTCGVQVCKGVCSRCSVCLMWWNVEQASVDSALGERRTIEVQLKEKVREVIELQQKFDAQTADVNARSVVT
jgi:hypothetical protein